MSYSDKFKMGGTKVWSPDKDLQYSFATTYSEGSQRTQYGKAIVVPLFTVEQYGYKATNIPLIEANKILKMIVKGKKFPLQHFSIYYMEWRIEDFYVAKGQMNIGELSDDRKYLSELSFNMTGVNPID